LKVLNIANNGIDTIGCFTLFVGLRENKSLSEINIDGNPIGEQGARILMKTVAYEGHRLKISANNCDFNIKSSNSKFNLECNAI
jgi:Ran GTPase-activating protein (RanGAP) involved in mRNA processing and transport